MYLFSHKHAHLIDIQEKYGDNILLLIYYKSKKGGKSQESIQSSTTPDPGYHMGK